MSTVGYSYTWQQAISTSICVIISNWFFCSWAFGLIFLVRLDERPFRACSKFIVEESVPRGWIFPHTLYLCTHEMNITLFYDFWTAIKQFKRTRIPMTTINVFQFDLDSNNYFPYTNLNKKKLKQSSIFASFSALSKVLCRARISTRSLPSVLSLAISWPSNCNLSLP